jgi:hypothetical protein
VRAIIKNAPGVLRVENPPFRLASVSEVDGTETIKLQIRFAFDAVKAVSEGRPTVTLTLKKNASSSAQRPLTPKTISIKESARAIRSLIQPTVQIGQISQTKLFKFDLLDSIPDESISSFKSGQPAKYEYLKSVKTSGLNSSLEGSNQATTPKNYLLSLVSSGFDPASLKENFPVADPVTGRKDSGSSSTSAFFTKRVSLFNDLEQNYVLSNFVIFEKEIEITKTEFVQFPVYEFEYVGVPKGSLSQSKVTVNLDVFEILSQLNSYLEPNETKEQKIFERRIDSYFAIQGSSFIPTGKLSSSPSIVRVVGGSSSRSEQKPSFTSKVFGNSSFSNGRGFATLRQEPDIFPFYVSHRDNQKFVELLKLPPESTRFEVLAKDITSGDTKFQVIASSTSNSESKVSVPISFVRKNSTYELKIRSYDPKNRATLSSNTIVFENKDQYQGAQLTITQPRSVSSSQSSILIGAQFTDSGRQDLSNIIAQLTAAGVSKEVISSLSNDSTLYSEIFSFRVETVDLATGLQSFSKELVPSADSPSAEYIAQLSNNAGTVLQISLGMKSPDSLVPAQPGFRFGKFGGFYRKSQPSSASIARNQKSGEQFAYVDTGIKATVFIPPNQDTGEIDEVSASRTFRSSTFLKWKYGGDISGVDHFQILGSADGSECLLGCSFGSLTFEDSILSGRVGTTKYSVRPVFLDLSIGNAAEVYQNVDTSLPDILSPKFSQGSTWSVRDGFFAVNKTQSFTNSFLGKSVQRSVTSANQAENVQLNVPQIVDEGLNNVTSAMNKKFAKSAPSISKVSTRIRQSREREVRKVSNVNK